MTVKRIINILILVTTATCSMQAAASVRKKDVRTEQKIEKVLSKMTLDEKIGQMTELSIDVLGSVVNGEFQLNKDKLHEAIGKFKVGSVLNAPGPVAQSREKWQEIIGEIQSVSMKEIGIPCIYGLDQNHGTTYTLDGTFFPQNINVGASFNPH
jgi:beta-glucosidase